MFVKLPGRNRAYLRGISENRHELERPRRQPRFLTRPTTVRHLVLAGMTGSVVVAYLSRTVLARQVR